MSETRKSMALLAVILSFALMGTGMGFVPLGRTAGLFAVLIPAGLAFATSIFLAIRLVSGHAYGPKRRRNQPGS